ncbi:N,N-dimethylformamidase beta subunit family domain-containing protein [Catellatospora vulcania]|uniref:N,N-dimethylformamidase beta subunit family domain-containing protein n=1 Tax=Catellatospora vulcania TaxID=1460450 RepID=UPI0012D41956|nr:N,N-dimethylformamidase beta subunit family domain-containing protein [Catellatospora vulcania]
MPRVSRRTALSIAVGSVVAGAGLAFHGSRELTGDPTPASLDQTVGSAPPRSTAPRPLPEPLPATPGVTATENALPGHRDWVIGADRTRSADDVAGQIKGYTSASTVLLGGDVSFHVSVADAEDYTVGVYRLGWYGGLGARKVLTSPVLRGSRQAPPELNPGTGMISCSWQPSWTLSVPADWVPGLYLAVFTTASGFRNYAPFVVRNAQRVNRLCLVLPFTTYQAYNQWPLDGVLGKSLYYGYPVDPTLGNEQADGVRKTGVRSSDLRSFHVSFDRPYMATGLPSRFDDDRYFIQWAEAAGYDFDYATSEDLHSGAIDAAGYAGLVFSGHDEYWSREMRDRVEQALAGGTSLAYMAANNVYWKIRFAPSADGRANRVVACYKNRLDAAGNSSATMRWRDPEPGPAEAEQRLLGVQYNGIVKAAVPLVVTDSGHWFWNGCKVKDGDSIPKVVAGEADGFDPDVHLPRFTTRGLLSASPYQLRNGTRMVQNTSLYETDKNAVVFVAGTLSWTRGLAVRGFRDVRLMRATENLIERMLRQKA